MEGFRTTVASGAVRLPRRQAGLDPIDVETRYGRLALPDAQADVIGRHLFRYGEWGWDEVHFVAATLPLHGARVLDVGAFVGTFGLGLALQRDLGAVCFVEANGAVAPLLAGNVERNCRAPATVIEALVDRPGAEPRPGRCAGGNLGAVSFARHASATPGSSRVPAPDRVVTMAELRAEHGELDLIKLDVEGMELDLLRSDQAHLKSGRSALWIECNEDPRSLAVAELLLRWGLPVYYFAFPAHNPDNLRGDPEPIFPVAYEAGLLAAPRSPPVLDDRLAAHRCVLRPIRSSDDLRAALWLTPRWGRPEWAGAEAQEVAALAGHLLRADNYDEYLGPGWAPGRLLGERLESERGRADAATSEALALRTRLEAQRERAEAAEQLLARATAEALDRLSELGAERERTEEADRRAVGLAAKAAAALRQAEAAEHRAEVAEHRVEDAKRRVEDAKRRAEDAKRRAEAIEGSTIWRITGPLRRAIGAHSRLRTILRRGASGIVGLSRPWR